MTLLTYDYKELCFRSLDLIVEFAEKLFGLTYADIHRLPLMLDLIKLQENEKIELFKVQILRYSYNTILTHSSKCNEFFDYCRNLKIKIFPVVPTFFCSFLLNYGRSGKTIGQINSLINSLNFVCKLFGTKSVSDSNYFRNTIHFLRKVCKRKTFEREGISLEMIEKLCRQVDKYGLRSSVAKRTYIMIIICFHTLMRFDCIKNVILSCIKFFENYVEITIPRSKTDQESYGQKAYLISNGRKFDPYFILCQYLYEFENIFGTADEYLLPKFKYDSNIKKWMIDSQKMLTYTAAYRPFKKLLSECGIDSKKLSLHSMRIGGTTEDFARNVPDFIIDQRGRWKDSKTKKTYCKNKTKHLVDTIRSCYRN